MEEVKKDCLTIVGSQLFLFELYEQFVGISVCNGFVLVVDSFAGHSGQFPVLTAPANH